MEKDQTRSAKCLRLILVFGFIVIIQSAPLRAAERIHTAYFSPAPGASAVIWVAKEARLFEKYGLDVAPVLIPSSVRTLQAILAGESAIAESAGPAAASARLAGGDIVALAGSVNILTYYFVTLPRNNRRFRPAREPEKAWLGPRQGCEPPIHRCPLRPHRGDAEGHRAVYRLDRSRKAHRR